MSSITSHYGYHMTMWHITKALSGQHLDLSSPGNRTLSFSPAVDCPFAFPVLLSGRLASVSCASEQFSLTFLSGDPVTLDFLAVSGRPYPSLPTTLSPGGVLQWR